jgi:hypothetical protein
MASNEYVNIGLAVLAVIILLFLIGSYYNSSDDDDNQHQHHQHRRQEGDYERRRHHYPDNNDQQRGNYHETRHRREGFNAPVQASPVPTLPTHPPIHHQVKQTKPQANIGDNTVSDNVPSSPPNTALVNSQPSTASVLKKKPVLSLGGSPTDSYPKDMLSANDLLPQDNNSTWNSSCPKVNGSLENKNFLEAGYHIGVNTIGQTLRNPNLQLRSEPPCPTTKVSPWQQSTIDPDLNRRPMEIGSC